MAADEDKGIVLWYSVFDQSNAMARAAIQYVPACSGGHVEHSVPNEFGTKVISYIYRLSLLLLLPMSGAWPGGRKIAGAAALAVEKVNADSTLLARYRLEYSWEDSGCSPQEGLKAMGKLLAAESRIASVIGPGCSSACTVTGHLSAGQRIPQVSYACSAPALSDKAMYELFSRTVAPETSKGPALISLMRHYRWTKAVMVR